MFVNEERENKLSTDFYSTEVKEIKAQPVDEEEQDIFFNTVAADAFVTQSETLVLTEKIFFDIVVTDAVPTKAQPEVEKLLTTHRYKFLKITEIFFSEKTQKEVFLQAMADWDQEVYEALEKDKDATLFMINVRNAYTFILTLCQKSPIGDLIEFAIKIAKQ